MSKRNFFFHFSKNIELLFAESLFARVKSMLKIWCDDNISFKLSNLSNFSKSLEIKKNTDNI